MEPHPLGLEPSEYWIVVAVLAVAMVGAFYYTFRNWRRARLIEDAPTAKIRSAHQGYLELEGEGQLMVGEPIIAPLTNKVCLWYRYKIERKEEHGVQGNRGSRWAVVRTETSDNLFKLVDETGHCFIDPEGAEVTTDDKITWYGDSEWPTSAPLVGSGRVFSGGGRYRYTEWLVLQAQPLYVIGEFRTISPAQAYTVAEISRDLVRTWKKDQAALLVRFDGNGDGEICVEEWSAVRKAAQTEAMMEHRDRAKQPDVHVIGRPSDNRHPFLLSVYPQVQLTRRYRLRAYLCLGGFFVAGAALTWMLAAA